MHPARTQCAVLCDAIPVKKKKMMKKKTNMVRNGERRRISSRVEKRQQRDGWQQETGGKENKPRRGKEKKTWKSAEISRAPNLEQHVHVVILGDGEQFVVVVTRRFLLELTHETTLVQRWESRKSARTFAQERKREMSPARRNSRSERWHTTHGVEFCHGPCIPLTPPACMGSAEEPPKIESMLPLPTRQHDR
jgi:hypothetical protein